MRYPRPYINIKQINVANERERFDKNPSRLKK